SVAATAIAVAALSGALRAGISALRSRPIAAAPA
ncbi:metal ABC transporter permease, partial [Clavibacter lycopersici]